MQPPDANPARTGTVGVTLQTSQGAIPMTLDRAQAPCAVNAVTSLAQQGFYNDTPCHRLTTGEGLKVLQCGDPTGSGSGGPGFRYAEEPPTNLAPSPLGQGASNYSRGLVAMAKTSQPDTTGSQFFLVYADSALPPQYTVVGRISDAGLAVLDKVAAAGSDNANGEGDGKPKLPVQITQAQVQLGALRAREHSMRLWPDSVLTSRRHLLRAQRQRPRVHRRRQVGAPVG